MHLEQDDIFEARKQLPNICLAGGMLTELLGSGSKEQCTDYARKLIDEVGRDGGFILGQDKMLTFKGDCNPDNLKAVCDFVQDYQG